MSKAGLCRSFYEIVRDRTVDTQAVTIPQEFCSTLSYLCDENSTKQDAGFDHLLLECSTWRLIGMLQEDIMESGMIDNSMIEIDRRTNFKSDADVVNDLFARSAELRRLQVVADWLQEAAGEKARQLYHACEIRWPNPTDFWASLNDGTYGEKVKQANCFQLDALFNDCNSLSPLLAEDIDMLYRAVFALLRAGELSRAQELCAKVGHPWLAAAIGGQRCFENVPLEQLHSNTDVGNRHRLLWQSICWNWLQQASLTPEKGNTYERAVFGLLCGRLDCVLSVTRSWHDRIWACVTTYINILTTKELVDKSLDDECFLPQRYFDQIQDIEGIFSLANACSSRPSPLFERVQACLIHYGLDNFSELLLLLLDVAKLVNSEMASDVSDDEVRFCLHVVQWLKGLGISPATDQALIPIYMEYTSILSGSPDNVDLAAFYTAQMPKPVNVDVFVQFLDICLSKSVSPADEDAFVKRSLFEARGVGLCVGKILCQLVRMRFSRFSTAKANESSLINCLTWYYLIEPILTASEGIMLDFVRFSNLAIRMFLLDNKSECARSVFGNIKPETMTVIAVPTLRSLGLEEHPPHEASACLVREYLCYKALFLAVDRLADWNATYTAFAHTQQQKDTLEMKDLERATEELVQATYNVLLFAGPGWLVDEAPAPSFNESQDSDDNIVDRQSQLDRLRHHFIPELTLSLSLCLARLGQSRRSDRVRLVDALMSSHPRNLASLFTKQQLQVIAKSAGCVLAE